MKTLIIYGSKHGCTEKCSKVLKDKLYGEVVVIDIKKDKVPDINSFDNIVIGGSIYAGRIQKEITEFCMKNIDVLKDKKIGLFVCCMSDGERAITQLNTCYPQELIAIAIVKEHLGGGFAFSKMNFFEKFIVKMVTKKENNGIKIDVNKDILKVNEEGINKFAQVMNSK